MRYNLATTASQDRPIIFNTSWRQARRRPLTKACRAFMGLCCAEINGHYRRKRKSFFIFRFISVQGHYFGSRRIYSVFMHTISILLHNFCQSDYKDGCRSCVRRTISSPFYGARLFIDDLGWCLKWSIQADMPGMIFRECLTQTLSCTA